MPVPVEVLAAFGLDGAVPRLLPGGQGTAWRVRDAVLKPADSDRVGRWFADVYAALDGPGFRVPKPVRSVTGDWVAHGWTCHEWVSGATDGWAGDSLRWPELVTASRALHAALADVPVPSWLAEVENPWTIGDAVAWGDRDPDPFLGPAAGPVAGQVRELLAVLRPVALPAQLIHADLRGNVLFDDGLPPAVIDFSPIVRPAGFPLAVAAIDTLQWCGAAPSILRHLNDEPELDQLLARALIYRHVTEIVRFPGTGFLGEVARTGQPVTDLVLRRITSPR